MRRRRRSSRRSRRAYPPRDGQVRTHRLASKHAASLRGGRSSRSTCTVPRRRHLLGAVVALLLRRGEAVDRRARAEEDTAHMRVPGAAIDRPDAPPRGTRLRRALDRGPARTQVIEVLGERLPRGALVTHPTKAQVKDAKDRLHKQVGALRHGRLPKVELPPGESVDGGEALVNRMLGKTIKIRTEVSRRAPTPREHMHGCISPASASISAMPSRR